MLYSLSPRLHLWWSFFLIAKYVQVSSEHSISLFQKSKIQQFPQHFMSVPCSSFCGIILMISFYLHICLVFLANTKSFASWSIDRSEHNSWYKPNTLKIFLRFTIPMRGVSGDSHEWLNMSSSGRLWGEWVETRKYVWWRGNGSLNGRFVANIEEIYGLIDPKAPAWTWRCVIIKKSSLWKLSKLGNSLSTILYVLGSIANFCQREWYLDYLYSYHAMNKLLD